MQGFFNLNKPSGCTSRQVVDAVKRCFRQSGFSRSQMPKLGHVGTLDPLASGVLVVAVGQATRLIDIIHARPKTYRGTFLLGRTSRTDDIESELTDVAIDAATRLTRDEVEAGLTKFRGPIEQVPPQFSAVHVAGQRAYDLARQGQVVVLAAKRVTIHQLDLLRFQPPELELSIECSSGTYIRSLGRDLGTRLGCGAVMSALIRTRVGPFSIEQAIPSEQLTAESFLSQLWSCRTCVSDWPTYLCNEFEQTQLNHGRSFRPRLDAWQPHALEAVPPNRINSPDVAIVDLVGELLAIGVWTSPHDELRPRLNLKH